MHKVFFRCAFQHVLYLLSNPYLPVLLIFCRWFYVFLYSESKAAFKKNRMWPISARNWAVEPVALCY